MTLGIKEGKLYRDGAGNKVGPMYPNPRSAIYNWVGYNHATRELCTYTEKGEYYSSGYPSTDDLVAEWVDEPAPAPPTDDTARLRETVEALVEALEPFERQYKAVSLMEDMGTAYVLVGHLRNAAAALTAARATLDGTEGQP